jgi:hypothetical protein
VNKNVKSAGNSRKVNDECKRLQLKKSKEQEASCPYYNDSRFSEGSALLTVFILEETLRILDDVEFVVFLGQ